MERKLQERMVGAGILVLALVVVGPLLLDGEPRHSADDELPPGQRVDEIRTHTFRLDQTSPGAPPRPAVAPTAPPPSPRPPRNEAVAGVERAEPAEAASMPEVAVPAAPKPQPVVESQPDLVPRKAEPPSSEEPRSRPAAAAKPEAATPARDAGGWVVQVGTFGQKANADRLVASLKRAGFDAYVSPSARGDKSLYRVRVGPAGARDEAAGLASRLAAAGHAGQVVAR
jgi:DedD protein